MGLDKRFYDLGMTEFTEVNRNIYRGKAIVESVTVAAVGANARCEVYDGEDTNGDKKAVIETLSGTTAKWQPGRGARFDRGIYIDVSSANCKVSITYTPANEA